MDIELNTLIRTLRSLPQHSIQYTTNWWLKEHLPGVALLHTSDSDFDPQKFAAYHQCIMRLRDEVHAEVTTNWNEDTSHIYRKIESGLFAVEWNNHAFTLLLVSWPAEYCTKQAYWLYGTSPENLDKFFDAVCAWYPEAAPTVEVFEDGRWQASRTLYHAIKSTTFDNLILAPGLKDEIKNDLSHFFESKDVYDRYGIPWKRGILLTGPPGNGKTHAVKSLINWLDKPALYVKSLQSRHYTEHTMMRAVFHRARTMQPCLLVLEDIESIVTPKNRSFFLNELDGFAANTGIVVLATTNHPERLDPAIKRPSRFDRKYSFDLPALPERRLYLAAWNGKIDADLQLSDAGLASVAVATDGFSFAFLKELIMASMMRWINLPDKPAMDDVMTQQIHVLRAQMAKMQEEPVPSVLTDDDELGDEDDQE